MDFRKVTPDSINYLRLASTAEQAKLYIKLTKLHRLAAQNVWFNQQCKRLKVFPNYIRLHVNTHNRASDAAVHKAKQTWLNEEVKHWFTVRDQLKLHLKLLHSELSYNLHNIEFDILDNKARDLASALAHKKFLVQTRKLERLVQDRLPSGSTNEETVSCHSFYPRVKNLSQTQIPPSEISLLEKGLKYNLQPRPSQKRLEELMVDSEVVCVKAKQDEAVKHQVATQIKKAYARSSRSSQRTDDIAYQSLRERLTTNNLILSKADKGNTIVILDQADYTQKVNDVIQGEDFIRLSSDPTKRFTTDIKNAIKSIQYLPTESFKYILPMNPRPPLLYGLPKIHKENVPIRPVVSYIGAPAYNLAKHLNDLLRTKASFKPSHSLKNSIDLVNKIKNIEIPQTAKLLSLDVESLFTNVPYEEVLQVLKDHFGRQRLHPGEIDDMIRLTEICMQQNYFRFDGQYYRQKEGLAMGSPLSPLMADLFMDKFECTHVVGEPKILFYHRYVDDIIICWTGTLRQIDLFVNKLNRIHPKIKFKVELEENRTLNFLDLAITRVQSKLEFQIYRKPTHTDTVIPNSSCHPIHHKLAAFRSYIHRLTSVPLTHEGYKKEINTIYQIAVSNGYNRKMIDALVRKKQRQKVQSMLFAIPPERINKFMGSLTYIGPLSERIANILHKNNTSVAFHTNNNLRHLTNGKDRLEEARKSGVYKLKCDECDAVYIGQTGRNFETRFKEHLAAYRNDHPEQSHFAKHLIETGHSLQASNTYEVRHICDKGFRLCVLEQLEILKHRNQNSVLLNDQTNLVTSPLLRIFNRQSPLNNAESSNAPTQQQR